MRIMKKTGAQMPEVCALVKPLTADGRLENETEMFIVHRFEVSDKSEPT